MKNYRVNLFTDEDNDPTIEGEVNNIGCSIVPSRAETGTYFLTAPNPIFDLRTKVFINNTSDLNHIKAQYDSPYRIRIVTRNGETGELQDGVMDGTSVYIELYEEKEYSNSDLATIYHAKSLLIKQGLTEEANRF